VTRCDELLGRGSATGAVVAGNGISAEEMWWAVNKDQCDPGLLVAQQIALVAGAWHDD
jgi:hypothetical protein